MTAESKVDYNGGPPRDGIPLIFLVDDEPMVLELAGLILRPTGYKLQKFTNPLLALDEFRRSDRKPDVVVTDYAMQEMNGLTLMDECRKIRPNQKVLLMSGTVSEDVFDQRTGVPDKFIAKPFDVGRFAVEVARLLP